MIAQGLDLLTERVVVLPIIPESYVGTKISDFKWIPRLPSTLLKSRVFERMMKRVIDFVASLIGILLLSPLMLVLAILVKLAPRPGLQAKTGYPGRRSSPCTSSGRCAVTCPKAPRLAGRWKTILEVTRIGSLMRKTSLDELPQLFNVLGGSMSLVGPRPERPGWLKNSTPRFPDIVFATASRRVFRDELKSTAGAAIPRWNAESNSISIILETSV